MKQGAFKSVRAAAKAAGIVRDATALEMLQRDWRKASQDERIAFLEWVDADMRAPG